jgi:DNA (cytosine-5)-methyltransferase 1
MPHLFTRSCQMATREVAAAVYRYVSAGGYTPTVTRFGSLEGTCQAESPARVRWSVGPSGYRPVDERGPMTSARRRNSYGVKLVRGPFVRLAPHERHCETADELGALVADLRAADPSLRLAADLFSGAGGLSLGLERAGFKVVLSVDHFAEAVETHRHHFAGMSVDWDLSDASRVEEVARLIRANKIDLLAGGPPCQPFSKAGRSFIRHMIYHGKTDPHNESRHLWRSFLEVVRLARPRAVLMENVPDMALDKEMFILRSMVEELEQLGYGVEERVIDTWRYGVPQFRQRLILVAIKDSSQFTWPDEASDRVSVWNAIGDMPEVEGGWRPEGGADGWSEYQGPGTQFQLKMRDGVQAADSHKLFDHITRPVREDDAVAFEAMDATTKYSDLPDEMKRYRDDIFDDKYKRLDENDLSRTITAHIAKDGYWYIHPRQGRTITVREAARLQTFPDWFRFAGPPSFAFRQIGNAVPPALAEHLGSALGSALMAAGQRALLTREVATVLAQWFTSRGATPRRLQLPWLAAESRWQVICAESLLERAESDQVRVLWPLIQSWDGPSATLAQAEAVRAIGLSIRRTERVEKLLGIARFLCDHNEDVLARPNLDGNAAPGLAESVANLATLVVPVLDREAADEPVLATKGILRVASRFTGEPVDRRNKLTDGRLAVARMIGGGPNAREAHLGLIELAASVCRPVDPKCADCPLADWCRSSRAENQHSSHLFRLPT